MMRSKSFDMQEVRGLAGGSRRVERLFHFMDENNGRSLSDGRKRP